jgi:hypothetical protein
MTAARQLTDRLKVLSELTVVERIFVDFISATAEGHVVSVVVCHLIGCFDDNYVLPFALFGLGGFWLLVASYLLYVVEL